MKITFNIQYHTEWGQQIAVLGAVPELGQNQPSKAFRLRYQNDGIWENQIDVEEPLENFEYKYVLVNDASEVLEEEGATNRLLKLGKKSKEHLFLKDSWKIKNHPNNPLYTSAFQEVIFRAEKSTSKKTKAREGAISLRFQIDMPSVTAHQQVCVLGNIPQLGNWDRENPLLLGNEYAPQWSAEIAAQPTQTKIEYKYGIYNKQSKKIEFLETGGNRFFERPIINPPHQIIRTDELFRYPSENWKGVGLAIPVFSLRSDSGFGVGEFNDLRLFADLSKKMGSQMIQILPINDTTATFTWVDSYPYAAISVFALHPLYLNIDTIEGFREAVNQKEYQREKKRLNALSNVDYEKVLQLKLKFTRQIFEQQKTTFLKKSAFKKYLKENGHWLKPYALFCYFRDTYLTVNFKEWKTGSRFSKSLLAKFTSPKAAHYDQIAYYYFLQFYLNKQLKEAADYARSQQVILKGDIPIGIYRYSVDAWVAPNLYNMNGQSGAPPDPFSDTGQNWGFPTYNWEEMAKNGYQWWQNRLKQLTDYFDAFRIDHILGFFRIWEIPLEQVEGSFGVFNKAIPIAVQEFAERGIPFDYDRFCQPYIPEHLVYQLFKADAGFVLSTFLDVKTADFYQFLPQYDTQRKVEAWFKQEALPDKLPLKKLLFSLLSNVLFFEVPGSNKTAFHPRIECLKTPSYRDLDNDYRHKISELYLDYFYHRQEDFWRKEAMTKLPAIRKATNMLICGEDLGMVPACVGGVMEELEILTLEIQRMSKDAQSEFLQSKDIPYWSVCSPSTHDMSPIRLWWEEMAQPQKIRFYQQELQQYGQPPEKLTPFLAKLILQQHLNFPSMWTVFPIQDIMAMEGELRCDNPMEERINVPANPQHYWRFRFHLTLETLAKKEDFISSFKGMVNSAGRGF